MTNIRSLILYGVDKNSAINIADASQIIDKFYVKQFIDYVQISIPQSYISNDKKYVLTFIDLYGNESDFNVVEFGE